MLETYVAEYDGTEFFVDEISLSSAKRASLARVRMKYGEDVAEWEVQVECMSGWNDEEFETDKMLVKEALKEPILEEVE